MKKQSTALTVIIAVFIMFLWGSLFTAVKLGYDVLGINKKSVADVLAFAGIRFTVCGIIISIFAACTKRNMRVSVKKDVPLIILFSLFGIILHYAFTNIGLASVESGKSALLKQLAVALFIPLSFIFVKTEKFKAVNIVSAILCLAGIIALNTNADLSFSISLPEILLLLASVCTVANNVVAKKVSETVEPIVLTGYSQIFGGVVLLIIGLAFGGSIAYNISLKSVLVMVYIAAASIISYCLWYCIVKNGELSMLFIIRFSEPLFAALTGALVLKENPFTVGFIVAFVLIIIAVTITTVKPKKKLQ